MALQFSVFSLPGVITLEESLMNAKTLRHEISKNRKVVYWIYFPKTRRRETYFERGLFVRPTLETLVFVFELSGSTHQLDLFHFFKHRFSTFYFISMLESWHEPYFPKTCRFFSHTKRHIWKGVMSSLYKNLVVVVTVKCTPVWGVLNVCWKVTLLA